MSERTQDNDVLPLESLKSIKSSLELVTKSIYNSRSSYIYHDVKTHDTHTNFDPHDFTRIKLELLKLNLNANDSCLLEHGKFMLNMLDACTMHDPNLQSKLYIYDHGQLMDVGISMMSMISTVTSNCIILGIRI